MKTLLWRQFKEVHITGFGMKLIIFALISEKRVHTDELHDQSTNKLFKEEVGFELEVERGIQFY